MKRNLKMKVFITCMILNEILTSGSTRPRIVQVVPRANYHRSAAEIYSYMIFWSLLPCAFHLTVFVGDAF